jgi:hypothetical protein
MPDGGAFCASLRLSGLFSLSPLPSGELEEPRLGNSGPRCLDIAARDVALNRQRQPECL